MQMKTLTRALGVIVPRGSVFLTPYLCCREILTVREKRDGSGTQRAAFCRDFWPVSGSRVGTVLAERNQKGRKENI